MNKLSYSAPPVMHFWYCQLKISKFKFSCKKKFEHKLNFLFSVPNHLSFGLFSKKTENEDEKSFPSCFKRSYVLPD